MIVLTAPEVANVLAIAEQATWTDGRNTAHYSMVKNNEQVDVKSPEGDAVAQIVSDALAKIMPEPKAMATPMLTRYKVNMRYGLHMDAEVMDGVRVNRSMTLFLSEPGSYDGGELAIVGQPLVKLPAGEAFFYDSGVVHEVKTITRGERLAVVCWMQI